VTAGTDGIGRSSTSEACADLGSLIRIAEDRVVRDADGDLLSTP
jgi:hypothetical protein